MKRLFLAIDFSEQVKDELSLLLPADMPGIRAVARNNLHLTLCFLGNADPDLVHQAISAIRLPRFPLSIQGYGAFHWSGAVFWAGLAPSNELLELHGQLSTALVRAGFSLEQRDYQPHITLARRRGKPPYPAIDWPPADAFEPIPLTCSEFSLFSSHPGRDGPGPDYRIEHSYPLD